MNLLGFRVSVFGILLSTVSAFWVSEAKATDIYPLRLNMHRPYSILFIGDSHSYGRFGQHLHENLSGINLVFPVNVHSYASCGSSPKSWFVAGTPTVGTAKDILFRTFPHNLKMSLAANPLLPTSDASLQKTPPTQL